MYKLLFSFIFAAFCLSATSFATNGNPVNSAKEEGPTMTTVTLTNVAPGAALGTWTSMCGGPYVVTFTNLTTGVRLQHFTTPNTQWPFTNLVVGNTYRLTVGDCNILFDDELITH